MRLVILFKNDGAISPSVRQTNARDDVYNADPPSGPPPPPPPTHVTDRTWIFRSIFQFVALFLPNHYILS